ncbi:MAG: hypothetical protein ACJ706_02005, partial [Nitrososphaeraceae archaeon]
MRYCGHSDSIDYYRGCRGVIRDMTFGKGIFTVIGSTFAYNAFGLKLSEITSNIPFFMTYVVITK